MKTIITTDNYEAYLLDYMEGNLSPDEAEQLKAFVAAQGLNWDELTEELPHLEAPQIAYEGKESLMQRPLSLNKSRSLSPSKGRSNDSKRIIPLYVKIASAAAAAGLLLTVTLWPEKSLPKIEPIAELKPIIPQRLITMDETTALPTKTIQFKQPHDGTKAKTTIPKSAVQAKVEMPLMATLEPIQPQALPQMPNIEEPDFEFLAYRMSTGFAPYLFNENDSVESFDNEQNLSFIGRGIYRLTNGKHDSFASLISSGLSTAKKEVSLAATDMALTAYYRAEEHFEEARERWEEKHEE